MRVRFLADADLNLAIVIGVLRREPAIDFLTAQVAGLRKMKDSAVLRLAADGKRVLVSHDVRRTMTAHFRSFIRSGQTSAGVFLVSQGLDIGVAIEELLVIWLSSNATEWEPISVAAALKSVS